MLALHTRRGGHSHDFCDTGSYPALHVEQVPKKGSGTGMDADLVAAGEAAIERGVLLFKLLGNLHAPSDNLPDVRLLAVLRLFHRLSFCRSRHSRK